MMDLIEKGSGSEEMKKSCVDCNTTKTPLWRGGPAGPKTLCNACGIKHRKKRRALMTMNKGGSQEKTSKKEISSTTPTTAATAAAPAPPTTAPPTTAAATAASTTTSSNHSPSNNHRKSKEKSKMDVALKLRLLTLGRQVLLRRSAMEKQRKFKLCEEEEAAILLMALSCGSIY